MMNDSRVSRRPKLKRGNAREGAEETSAGNEETKPVHAMKSQSPMTKLYIDDLRNAPDDSWVVARTVTGAIRVLATMDVEVISLDHDIAHHVSVDGHSRPFACVENFSAVCYFIGEKYKGLTPPTILLHTSNPVGAQRMRHILASYGLKSAYQPGKPVHEICAMPLSTKSSMPVT